MSLLFTVGHLVVLVLAAVVLIVGAYVDEARA